DPILVDALAERFLQPHPAATRATTERLRPATLHLPHPDADRHQGLPRSLADSIVPRAVTAVVVGYRHVEHRLAGADPAIADQLRDHLRMVQDLEVPTELRVLVPQRSAAIRALGDDLLHGVSVQRLLVLLPEVLDPV